MENELTFEQINDHINKAKLSIFKEGGKKHFGIADIKTAPGDVLQKVCSIYHVIRPVLQGILLIPFIPATWKQAVKTFLNLMDTLCPS